MGHDLSEQGSQVCFTSGTQYQHAGNLPGAHALGLLGVWTLSHCPLTATCIYQNGQEDGEGKRAGAGSHNWQGQCDGRMKKLMGLPFTCCALHMPCPSHALPSTCPALHMPDTCAPCAGIGPPGVHHCCSTSSSLQAAE